ncbi:DUF169 domain-containing protein [bacterium]|nr:DUF169 domain-containing protein [bacterium]
MEWIDYALKIKKVLNLEGSPIAVTYSLYPPKISDRAKVRVCNAFLDVSHGKIIDLTSENSACQGGTWHLGLGERPSGERDKALKEFLTKGEKIYCTITAFHRALSLTTPPPMGLAEHVVMSPMEKAELKPDIVMFICNAHTASRLITLDTFETGIPPKIDLSGATCHQAIAYPIVSGETNISLMDFTSRKIKGYKYEDLLVSIPYHKFHGVMRSIEGCTAGTAKFEVPEIFKKFTNPKEMEDFA